MRQIRTPKRIPRKLKKEIKKEFGMIPDIISQIMKGHLFIRMHYDCRMDEKGDYVNIPTKLGLWARIE